MEYYSALHSPTSEDIDPMATFYSPNGRAFVHDLQEGIPIAPEASVLYSDLPWKHGYNIFYQRAGVFPKLTWEELMLNIAKELDFVRLPAVMIIGKTAAKIMKPHNIVSTTINGGTAVAGLWNMDSDGLKGSSEDILRTLAQRYDVVCDFAAGYGRAGRIFVEAGKRYVLSDISPECIGYIGAHDWEW